MFSRPRRWLCRPKAATDYQTVVASVDGQPVTTEFRVNPRHRDTASTRRTRRHPGLAGRPRHPRGPEGFADRRLDRRGGAAGVRRVVTVCTGAFLAAQAGLLDGCVATTHWAFTDQLAREFPSIVVDPGPDFRAQLRQGVDRCRRHRGYRLGIVAGRGGSRHRVAQTVARWLVLHLRRPGGQTQFAAPVWAAARQA